MNKENAVRKNIHLYKENVEQLKFLSKHSFTNDSQYIRRLIAKNYQNLNLYLKHSLCSLLFLLYQT